MFPLDPSGPNAFLPVDDAIRATLALNSKAFETARFMFLWRDLATGSTLLHFAAKRKNPRLARKVVETCSQLQADELIGVKDNAQHTAMHECAGTIGVAVLDVLVQHSPKAAMVHGGSVRDLAVKLKRAEIIEYMTLVMGKMMPVLQQLARVNNTLTSVETSIETVLNAVHKYYYRARTRCCARRVTSISRKSTVLFVELNSTTLLNELSRAHSQIFK
jgi:hypothetical protein